MSVDNEKLLSIAMKYSLDRRIWMTFPLKNTIYETQTVLCLWDKIDKSFSLVFMI